MNSINKFAASIARESNKREISYHVSVYLKRYINADKIENNSVKLMHVDSGIRMNDVCIRFYLEQINMQMSQILFMRKY